MTPVTTPAPATSLAPHLVDELQRALDAAPVGAVRRNAVPLDLLGKATVSGLLRDAGMEWLLLFGLWAAMWAGPRWLWPLWILLVAGRLHGLGVILHDAAHMPLREKGFPVRLLEVMAGYPVATTLDAMRYHHLRHHRDSGMGTDPYFKAGVEERRGLWLLLWLRGLLLIPFWTVRPLVGTLAVFVPALRNAYGRAFLQDRTGVDLRDSVEVLRCAREELGQMVFQAALVVLWARFPLPIFYAYVIPVSITGLLSSYRVLAEHVYRPTTDRRVETLLATTCDHGLGIVGRLFLAPHNIGFHVVHHLHPQTSWTRLPNLRAWYVEHHPEVYPQPGRRSASPSA